MAEEREREVRFGSNGDGAEEEEEEGEEGEEEERRGSAVSSQSMLRAKSVSVVT